MCEVPESGSRIAQEPGRFLRQESFSPVAATPHSPVSCSVRTWDTGADLATALGRTPTGTDPRFFNYVELVRFDGFGADGFDKIEFSSVAPAFEFALAPVPAAGMLLLTALGGRAVLHRRKAA